MRYRALDTNLLVMLDILLDTGSVTRTGESLGLSQPAVSAALGRLREHFGDDLLKQVGRINVPTPLAEKLRRPLKDLLVRTDALIAMRSDFDPRTDERRFSLVFSDFVAAVLGHAIVREVASAGPYLSVEHDSMRLDSFERFERGEIDMVIIPEQVAFGDHPTMKLFDERFVCAVWTGHPTIGATLTAEQYLEARHVVHRSRSGSRQTILDESFLHQSAIERKTAIEVPTFTDILEALPGTPFVATVQERLVAKLARRLPLRIVEPPFDFPLLPIVMRWHRHLDDDEGLRWFRAVVGTIVSQMETEPGL